MSNEIDESNFMAALCEEYEKGENANWENVTAERVGVSRNAFIEVGKELKRKGYLPNFSTTKSNNADIIICFIGEPSDEAKRLFEEINAE